jgi:hypothetical protein
VPGYPDLQEDLVLGDGLSTVTLSWPELTRVRVLLVDSAGVPVDQSRASCQLMTAGIPRMFVEGEADGLWWIAKEPTPRHRIDIRLPGDGRWSIWIEASD